MGKELCDLLGNDRTFGQFFSAGLFVVLHAVGTFRATRFSL
jgi:hypothetical protein